MDGNLAMNSHFENMSEKDMNDMHDHFMNQPDFIHKDKNDDIWYSDQYLKAQIDLAYQAGLAHGVKIQFHSVMPYDAIEAKNCKDEFFRLLDIECQKRGHVWKQYFKDRMVS